MLVDSVYTTFRFDKDYSKKSLTAKLLAAFDRSGLGGIYVDINRSIEALTDNRIGIAPLMGEGKPYGSSMKSVEKVKNIFLSKLDGFPYLNTTI